MPALTLANIHFQRDQRPILAGVSWAVAPGELAAIVGPNGCGKSTLLRLIAGYLWPTAGTVSLLGATLGQTPVAQIRKRISIVEATTVYPFDDEMTALDVVVSGYFSTLSIRYVDPTPEQYAHAREALAAVGLGDRADQLYLTLSTGQRMRTLIARALVHKPELILLDEPTAGLDLPARETVLATMLRLHETTRPAPPAIIVVTHHLEELLPGTANILLLGADGRSVAAGSPEAVLTDAQLTAAYRWPIHVLHRNRRWHAHVDPQAWPALLPSL